MDEYISRKAVLQTLQKANIGGYITERLLEIPSADVQPVCHGRWIGINEYCKKNGCIPSGIGIYFWCSECEKAEPKISDYCPNCGAQMVNENDP